MRLLSLVVMTLIGVACMAPRAEAQTQAPTTPVCATFAVPTIPGPLEVTNNCAYPVGIFYYIGIIGSSSTPSWSSYWPLPANKVTSIATVNFQSFIGMQECPENYEPYKGSGQPVVSGTTLSCVFDTPNIGAISVTPTNNGIMQILVSGSPLVGTGAFSIATQNIGAAATVTATVSHSGTGSVSAEICETNASAACTDTPAVSIPVSFLTGGTPTFTVFVGVDGHIPASDNEQVKVTFTYNGQNVGQTSVAVQTN